MIDRVHFENFKSLKDVTIELGPLTVLVGPNGCGKSSVLQGIHLLSQTGLARKTEKNESRRRHRFSSTFGGARDPRRLTSPERPTRIRLAMREAGGDELSLTVTVPATSDADPAGDRLQFRVSVAGPEGSLSATVPQKKARTRGSCSTTPG